MGRWSRWVGMAYVALCLVGCGATGPRYSEIESKLPPLEKDQGRIFFYRASFLGGAVQPDVRLNGQVIGTSQPNSFFFVDRPEGNYKASAQTEAEATVNVKVLPMTVSYVAMGITMGIMVGRPTFSLVTETQAKSDLPALAYGGSVPVSTRTAATSQPTPAASAQSASPATSPVQSGAAATAPAPTVSAGTPAASGSNPFAQTSMQDLQFLMPAAR